MKLSAKLFDGSGLKSSILWDEDTDAWTYSSNNPGNAAPKLYRTIPTLYRAIEKNGDALSKIPFAIFQGKNEYDTSQAWENKIEYMPNPRRLFTLTSHSLDKCGCAYWLKNGNKAGFVKELLYLAPQTITLVFACCVILTRT